tara:strand:+ start:369 stop:524 length:156 start_codon:yes stop_codon:yes gene_type:complete
MVTDRWGRTMRFFNTERDAEKAKRKFKKYKATKNYKWAVQGNALVRVRRKK